MTIDNKILPTHMYSIPVDKSRSKRDPNPPLMLASAVSAVKIGAAIEKQPPQNPK